MSADKLHIAMVDDHQIVLDGLKALIKGHPRFELAIESNDPSVLLDHIRNQPVDILITDIMMPGMTGLELARKVRDIYPDIRILALSMNGEGNLVNQMIHESGISGYILKNISRQELLTALEKVAEGGVYFSDEVMEEMLRDAERKTDLEEAKLTQREIEIIRLIEKEFSNKMIAEALFLSERTIETHRKNILRKTKTSSVLGLIKYAYEHQLIDKK